MSSSSAPAVLRHARAKLNLSLHVTGRRKDGYHELDGLVAFADLGDTLRAEPASSLSLAVEGPYAEALDAKDDNLVLRAARMLAAHAGVEAGARLTLDKHIPVAAGLGGGSADAAAALEALATLWDIEVPGPELMRLALALGADVPVCLYGHSAFISGIGESIGPAPHLPTVWLVLVNPGVPLSTAEVFSARTGGFSPLTHRWQASPASAWALAEWLRRDRNDLEDAAKGILPDISQVLTALRHSGGCLLARMSGSGGTCFGLYSEHGSAEAAAAQIAVAHPGWWVRHARLVG